MKALVSQNISLCVMSPRSEVIDTRHVDNQFRIPPLIVRPNQRSHI